MLFRSKERREEKHTKKSTPKIRVERLEKEPIQRVKLQTYTIKKEQEKKERKEKREVTHTSPVSETSNEKSNHAQELVEQADDEGTDWVTTIVWIAVILLAGYFVWSYLQPVNAPYDGTQCAINLLSQSGTTLNIEKEKNTDVRILIRDALSTPNLNEARTYYTRASCGDEQECNKSASVVITPESLTSLGITKAEKCRRADNVIVCDNGLIIDGATATIGNKAVHMISIVNKGVGTTTTYVETALQSASVYEGKEGLQSITYPRELEGSTAVRMYTRDTLEDTSYKITYESENPRIVGYTIG